MRRGLTWALGLSMLGLLGSTRLEASVVLHQSGGGSAQVVYEGQAYIWPTGSLYNDTMISKTFSSLQTMKFDDVTYLAGDLDWSDGFRWTERIYNNTEYTWTDYHLFLDDTEGVFFTNVAAASPNFAKINGGGDIPGSGKPTIELNASFGTVVVSSDRKSESYYFATPLLPGQFFDIHAPIEGLAHYTEFGMAQYATIPEPATIIVWSLLGLAVAGYGVWRRKQTA
jgi:hypothetical protein